MSIISQLTVALVSTVFVLFGSLGSAKAETLTFDELGSPTAVDGLTVKGVTFDFKIDGVDDTNATYNSTFPPQFPPNLLVNIQQPFLQGNAKGLLTLDFAEPISALKFDVGLETFNALTPGYTVELFDLRLNSLGVKPVNTNPLARLSEGPFSYSGGAVKRAILDFDETKVGFNPSQQPRFTLDNLTYVSISEPSSFLGLLALGGGLRLLRKRC